jgi:transaldolase
LTPASIEALERGEGTQRADAVLAGVDEAEAALGALSDAGVDFDDVTTVLEHEGVAAFADSFRDALATIAKHRAEMR